MTLKIDGYRIFFASPSGLEHERKAFKEILDEYNTSDANPRRVHFYPVEMENVLGGVGRPQAKINELLRECDYMILVLHDRWGSPTSKEGEFTSGTEEEYNVGLECFCDEERPMRQVVPFFKALLPERRVDPGQQLRKVLKFNKDLRDAKEVFFHDYDDIESFSKILRRHLARWLHDHEKGETGKIVEKIPALPAPTKPEVETIGEEDLSPDEKEMINKAQVFVDEGKLFDAEEWFARAAIKGNNPAAINAYGAFLFKIGRLSQAVVMFERVGKLANLMGNQFWLAVSYGNIGLIYHSRGDLDKAEIMHLKSLDIYEKIGHMGGMADTYGNLGVLHQTRRNSDKAEEMFHKSLEINKEFRRLKQIPAQYGNLGIVYATRGEMDKAEEMFRKSLEMNMKLELLEGTATNYVNLGNVYLTRGESDKAAEMYRKSLEISKKLGNVEGMALVYGNLGNIYLTRGESDKAEEMHRKSLEISEKLGRIEGMASDHGNLGLVYRARGDMGKAEEYLERAKDLFSQIGMPEEVKKTQAHLDSLNKD